MSKMFDYESDEEEDPDESFYGTIRPIEDLVKIINKSKVGK